MISVSILGIKEDIKNNINKLDRTNIDYFHVDVMDGIFVQNKTEDIIDILSETKSKKDVHLMVKDIKKYIDLYSKLNPTYITFHFEATQNPKEIITYLKKKNIKIGLSIKPNTDVEQIKELLSEIDLVLVMSVEPGKGGQQFIENSTNKINKLYELRTQNNYNFIIEVDGGINNITKDKVKNADILVVGSYITNSENYEEQIQKLKDQ